MSFEYIQETYRVPAKCGGRIEYTGDMTPKVGVITGTDGARLLIKLEGEKESRRYHPTWEIRYLDEALEGGAA